MPNTVSQAVAAELRATIARLDLTQADVADRAGRSPVWVSRRLRYTVPLDLDDFALVCRALDLDPVEVLTTALAAVTAPTP